MPDQEHSEHAINIQDREAFIDLAAKKEGELDFWNGYLAEWGLGARTGYYRDFMLRMGGLKDVSFFDDLVCVDIGCGPMGSMTWLPNAKAAIGLDPLVGDYMRFDIAAHNMIYLDSPAESMPFADNYVDVVFSMNSLDHVDDLFATCREIRRVIKPGGSFIASINLNEPVTECEPWTLDEALLEEQIFQGWERQYYEVRPKIEGAEDPYRYFHEEVPSELEGKGVQALWCRFRVPDSQAR